MESPLVRNSSPGLLKRLLEALKRSEEDSAASGAGPQNLNELERRLGYRFQDRRLLVRALTHKSFSYQQSSTPDPDEHYENLEFLGDAILGFVVADYLFRHCSGVREGGMTRMRSQLVSAGRLAQVSTRLGLGRWLRLSRGEEKTGGRLKKALLADVFESIVGALYLDGGLEVARSFILRELREELERAGTGELDLRDPKSALQERLHQLGLPTPWYKVLQETGPEHRKHFLVGVYVNGEELGRGEGRSKKEAEQKAAREALARTASPKRSQEPVKQSGEAVEGGMGDDRSGQRTPPEVETAKNEAE